MKNKSFLIVGGGTAGWMAAMLFQRAMPDCSITLIESSCQGVIGVGEGSTPALKTFMDAVGIAELDWMPACQASFKSGISFQGWTQKKGFEEYFHPFYSYFDRDHFKALQFNTQLRRAGKRVHAHPNAFSYSHYLASRSLCPHTPFSFPFEVQYGYHFDSGLLGEFLKKKALERGVKWKSAHIDNVMLDSQAGDICCLVSSEGERLEADFFIDCSGFSSILTKKALDVSYHSYSDILFNDRAVTLATSKKIPVSTQTTSTAMKNGWRWSIPLQSRTGNGYVYSSRHCSSDEAESELRQHLGIASNDGEVKHLKMKVGRVESVWNKNCLAVGLSQGFLEPLEATALALVQLTISRFIKYYQSACFTDLYRDRLNIEIAEAFDNVKEYIHAHFLTSDRTDTQYWRDCQANTAAISPRLKSVFRAWMNNGDLLRVLDETGLNKHYKINSWVYLLSGMGIFPPENALSDPAPIDMDKVPISSIRDFFERCTLNHVSQDRAFTKMSEGDYPLACHKPLNDELEKKRFERLVGASGAESAFE